MDEQYPPNSKIPKRTDKDIKRVTSEDPIRRKKPLGKQFGDTFFGGDAQTAAHYVIFGVMIPAAKDMIVDGIREGIEKLVYGDNRSKQRRYGHPGNLGHVSYNQYAKRNQPPPQRAISKFARSRHNFDEIVLTSRSEAEDVIDRLFDLVSQYDSATVADLYLLTGLESSHPDHKWGWTELKGAGVSRTRTGYLLDLPDPEPLD